MMKTNHTIYLSHHISCLKCHTGSTNLIITSGVGWVAKSRTKIEPRFFKSSEHINEKRDGPYRGFGFLSLFSDPLDLAKWSQREILGF